MKNRRATSSFLVPLVLLSLAASARADVLRVGPTRLFAEVQGAIDAALEGDVVLVDAGSYTSFAIDALSLSVVAERGALVEIVDSVTVTNLVGGQVVLLQGLTVEGSLVDTALSCVNNAGAVRVEDCTVRNGGSIFYIAGIRSTVDLVLCADVSFTGCALESRDGSSTAIGPGPGAGLALTDSTAAVYDCTVRGPIGYQGTTTAGGPGLSLTRSFLFASDSRFEGGRGGEVGSCFGVAAPGGPGVLIDDAASELVRLADVGVVGGPGGFGQSSFHCPVGGGPQGPPSIVNGGTLTVLYRLGRGFTMPSPTREGELVATQLTGIPGDLVGLIYGLVPEHLYDVSVSGTLLVDIGPGVHFLPIGVVPPSGILPFSFTQVPMAPGVGELTFLIQPLFINTTGTLLLGEPVSAVLLDDQF